MEGAAAYGVWQSMSHASTSGDSLAYVLVGGSVIILGYVFLRLLKISASN